VNLPVVVGCITVPGRELVETAAVGVPVQQINVLINFKLMMRILSSIVKSSCLVQKLKIKMPLK